MSMFRVGQKVVCVNNGPHPYNPWGVKSWLDVRGVYTIRRVAADRDGSRRIWLAEVRRRRTIGNLFKYGSLENGFFADRFRPVSYKPQSLEHDAETFRKIAGQVPPLKVERT